MLSSVFDLYSTNVYVFSHANNHWVGAFAGGGRNIKAGSYAARSS